MCRLTAQPGWLGSTHQLVEIIWLAAAAAAAAAASPATAPATAPPGLGLDETLEFIERSKVCLGRTLGLGLG